MVLRIIICTLLVLLCPKEITAQKIKASAFGYKALDATEAFMRALQSSHDTILIDRQKEDWILSPVTLRNLTNKTIVFESGVVVKAKKNAFLRKGDVLLKLINCENINILGYGAQFIMNKEEYTDGEWRMGISMLSSKAITVKGLVISNSGGDGVYIGGARRGEFSENIYIEDIVSENHKRQGISIVSARNVKVVNSIFKNTKGVLPGAGVDIEPDHPEDRIENITFENCVFTGNDHAGILLALTKLTSASVPVQVRFSGCYLKMNHLPSNSYAPAEIVINANATDPVKGKVEFENLFIDGSLWGVLYTRKLSKAFQVTFRNCYARNICQKGTMPPFYFEVPDYFNSSGPLGGFTFENFYIDYESNLPVFKIKGSSLRTLKGFENITGRLMVRNKYEKSIEYIKYHPAQNRGVSLDFQFEDIP
ncbi:right-handed parallel beta-helix repeat-containing protein [Ascidiimonas aurantiaca]|uniref:right-handed parallel beta-helix repeat-containing protein n=1 Tax=Ascidiimonas aurantiaca TaxID=1685432 RepID=UPI0030ED0ABD